MCYVLQVLELQSLLAAKDAAIEAAISHSLESLGLTPVQMADLKQVIAEANDIAVQQQDHVKQAGVQLSVTAIDEQGSVYEHVSEQASAATIAAGPPSSQIAALQQEQLQLFEELTRLSAGRVTQGDVDNISWAATDAALSPEQAATALAALATRMQAMQVRGSVKYPYTVRQSVINKGANWETWSVQILTSQEPVGISSHSTN